MYLVASMSPRSESINFLSLPEDDYKSAFVRICCNIAKLHSFSLLRACLWLVGEFLLESMKRYM